MFFKFGVIKFGRGVIVEEYRLFFGRKGLDNGFCMLCRRIWIFFCKMKKYFRREFVMI